MKSHFSLKKVSVVSAAFLLLASQAQAQDTFYTLTGQLHDIIDNDQTGVTVDTPVTLELSWTGGETIVPLIGEATAHFRGKNNFSTLTIGSMEFKETPLPIDATYPSAHFVDSELTTHVVDGKYVSYSYFYSDVDVDTDGNGTLDATLSCFVRPDADFPYTRLSIEITDESNWMYGDWFYGYIDFGASQPVLVGDDDEDGDVDGLDVASFASTGGDLTSLALNFGEII